MKLKKSSYLIAGALLGALAMPAQADDAMMDLLKVLRDKGTISAQDYQLLQRAAASDKEMEAAEKAELKEEVKTATADMPKITTKGKIKIEDRDGNWAFQPIGRVMWDAIDTDADGGDDAEATELRRARLGFQGNVYDWGYKFEADFAGGNASIKDAKITYGNSLSKNVGYGITLGQSHIPFGLNTKISSKYMSFMDRPFFADSSISPARESGVVGKLNDSDYRWMLSAGLTNGSFGGGDTVDNGTTFAARGHIIPFMADKEHLLQIGAGYLTRSGDEDFSFDQRLVSHIDNNDPVTGAKYLDTSVNESNLDGTDAFTIDAMGIYGSFHAMAEYLDYSAEQEVGSDIDIDGYAVEAGYFLTGESLKWKKGYTSGITPNSEWGAWQVAARFETLEIDDTSMGNDEVDKFTVGVNYYPRQNLRLMLNYDKVTDLKVNGTNRSEEPSALKFRAQAYW